MNSVNKSWESYYVPGIIQSARDRIVNRTDKNPSFHEASIPTE